MGISSMNSSLNMNRELLKNGKRIPFTKMNGSIKKKSNYRPYVLPQIPPHMLRRVRIRVRKQNRRMSIKKVIVGCITILILTVCLMYID